MSLCRRPYLFPSFITHLFSLIHCWYKTRTSSIHILFIESHQQIMKMWQWKYMHWAMLFFMYFTRNFLLKNLTKFFKNWKFIKLFFNTKLYTSYVHWHFDRIVYYSIYSIAICDISMWGKYKNTYDHLQVTFLIHS